MFRSKHCRGDLCTYVYYFAFGNFCVEKVMVSHGFRNLVGVDMLDHHAYVALYL